MGARVTARRARLRDYNQRKLSLLQVAGLLLLCAVVGAEGQIVTSAPPPDPLMNLLLSQPKIDFAAPVKPVVSFDPAAVGPGEESVYRVTFNALEASIEFPTNLSFPVGFAVRTGGRGQLLQMTGTGMEAKTTFNFHVRASAPGEYTMPAYRLRVYGKTLLVPAAHLSVMASPPRTTVSQPKLNLELPTTNLYVGQSMKVRVTVPFPPGVPQTLSQVQLNGQGFIVDQTASRQMFEPVPLGGPGMVKYVYETMLTPIAAGSLTFFAQGFSAHRAVNQSVVPGMNPGASQVIAYSTLQYTLLDSDPAEVNVRPLPREGELPGFTGAIGYFTNDPPQLATNVIRVGDPAKLTVTVRGDGNMVRLVAPPPPQVRDWQVFAASGPDTPAPLIHVQGAVTFTYTVIPLTEKARGTPRIPFSYFDPNEAKYRDLSFAIVPVKVVPGAVRPDANALALRERQEAEEEPEPTLSGLARKPGATVATLLPVQHRSWFPVIQLIPGALAGGLWLWDRRRRYLQAHPQVVCFRRGRRALRRERRLMRRAANRGDATAFAERAVGALRAAAAPHFPAYSEALVGTDVLSLLDAEQRDGRGGTAVRQLFAATDARRFGTGERDLNTLLTLKPEIENVLGSMEERLCT
jgi:hypothetical protein